MYEKHHYRNVQRMAERGDKDFLKMVEEYENGLPISGVLLEVDDDGNYVVDDDNNVILSPKRGTVPAAIVAYIKENYQALAPKKAKARVSKKGEK